jgi:hypothetical protein
MNIERLKPTIVKVLKLLAMEGSFRESLSTRHQIKIDEKKTVLQKLENKSSRETEKTMIKSKFPTLTSFEVLKAITRSARKTKFCLETKDSFFSREEKQLKDQYDTNRKYLTKFNESYDEFCDAQYQQCCVQLVNLNYHGNGVVDISKALEEASKTAENKFRSGWVSKDESL